MVTFSELFKLPEDEVQFVDFIRLPLFLCRATQFRFEKLDEQATFKDRLKFYARLAYFAFCVFCLTMAFVMMWLLASASLDDFALASSCVLNSCSIVLVSTKTVIAFLGKSKFRKMFEELDGLSKRRLLQKPHSKRVYGVKGYLRKLNFHFKVLFWINLIMFGPVVFPVVPFILYGTMKQAVSYYFPFDPYQAHTFPIAIIWIDYIAWSYLIYTAAVDFMLYALITVLEMEFNCLKVDWLAFQYTVKHERSKQIGELVDRHNKLLDLVDLLQSIYSFSFLVSVVISSFILCFSAFQLSIAKDLDTFIFYAAYFLLIMSQIWFLCLYGQKLINASVAVAEAVYHCEWEDIRDASLKKKLLLVILRAQKPARLSAMSFADISFPTFTSILTTTGSYFTLLQNVYAREG